MRNWELEIAKKQRRIKVQNFKNKVETFSDEVAILLCFFIGISLMKSVFKHLGK
tara:strand:+ start:180 stop:341 length:162 start_codon:yes stop_codon:yes gene_type:complete